MQSRRKSSDWIVKQLRNREIKEKTYKKSRGAPLPVKQSLPISKFVDSGMLNAIIYILSCCKV